MVGNARYIQNNCTMVEITDIAGSLFTRQYRAVKLADHQEPKNPYASKGSVRTITLFSNLVLKGHGSV